MGALTVGELMTKGPACFRCDDSVLEADVGMQLGNVRHLPVLDDDGRLVGILSNRDVLRAHKGGMHAPVLVREVMTVDPITVAPEAPADEAAQTLLDEKIGALPVVDTEGNLVGIVTESDFVGLALRLLRGQPARRDDRE